MGQKLKPGNHSHWSPSSENNKDDDLASWFTCSLATEGLTRQTVNRGRLNCTWNLCPCINYQLLHNSPLNWAVKSTSISSVSVAQELRNGSWPLTGHCPGVSQDAVLWAHLGGLWAHSSAVGGIWLLRGYWTEATLSSPPRVSPEGSSQPGSWLCSGQIQGGIFLHPDLGHDIPPLLLYSVH